MANPKSQVSTIDDEPEAAVTTTAQQIDAGIVKASGHDDQLSGKRLTITIFASEGKLGGEAVPVNLNGVLYQIPRNKPCSVPEEVVGVLYDAVTVLYSGEPGGETIEQRVPRYNFQVAR